MRICHFVEPHPDRLPAAVRCLSCRAAYVPEADGASGCPLCGCVSWLSIEVADEVERTRRRADDRLGSLAISVLGWGGMLGRERERDRER